MHCESEKQFWDKLKKNYEGDDNVKKENFQTHRRHFKSLKMKYEEDVAAYFLCVDELSTPSKDLVRRLKNQ
jgi:hypothetical protein